MLIKTVTMLELFLCMLIKTVTMLQMLYSWCITKTVTMLLLKCHNVRVVVYVN